MHTCKEISKARSKAPSKAISKSRSKAPSKANGIAYVYSNKEEAVVAVVAGANNIYVVCNINVCVMDNAYAICSVNNVHAICNINVCVLNIVYAIRYIINVHVICNTNVCVMFSIKCTFDI